MCNIKYLLGIDGGGTKTEFLLTDSDENEVRRLFLGASNPVSTGIENIYYILNDGINEICNGFDLSEISVFAGISGAKLKENQRCINIFLSRFGFALYNCGSDIELALEASLKCDDGTAVIMGTGIVAYSRSGENLRRSGGYGYMIDKGGSGFHFGSDALNAAFEFIDGRGGSKTLLNLIEAKLGKRLADAVTDIYNGGASFIASFAPVVFEAYNLGDAVAKKIIEQNAFEAAKIINGANKNGNNKIVVCGGLCKQKEILSPYLMKFIEGEVSLAFIDEPIVNGAISLAKRLCDNA